MNWKEHKYFGGLDWGNEHHDLVIVDQEGKILVGDRFEHNAAGWQRCRKVLADYAGLMIAVETTRGLAVEQLLEAGCTVYPVNPKSAARYRERVRPSGCKDDRHDAWSLADALRVDGLAWKALGPEDALVVELRALCRDEEQLIEERTALVNQLQQGLRDYYPAALEAFSDWTHPSCWAFLEQFPTPQKLITAGRRRWEKFLHQHKLWRPQTAEHRLEVFARADQLQGTEAMVRAKSMLVATRLRQLRALQQQLELYRKRIEKLFAEHPDHDLFGSLPGGGPKIAPRLLSELGSDRNRFECAEHLQMFAGTAPVTKRSGKTVRRKMRYACNRQLRHTVHLWANLSRQKCAWAEAYYQAHRKKGKTHACALRCLGQRWLKILWKIWHDDRPYDEAVHTRNQVRHGSWILSLNGP